MNTDLKILKRQVGTLEFNNPIIFGGGTCKTFADVEKACQTDVGGIEIGSITPHSKSGNAGPVTFKAVYRNGVLMYTLNSLGLTNPGKENVSLWAKQAIELAHKSGKKIGINVTADTIEEIIEMVVWALELGFDWVTINGGCPNKYDSEGRALAILTFDTPALQQFLQLLSVRVGPNVGEVWWKPAAFTDTVCGLPIHAQLIGESNVITGYIANNTIGHCFAFNELGDQAISPAGGLAGMGGPAVKPIALGHLRMLDKMLPARCHRIGSGGVIEAEDAIDHLRAKASLVHVTSLVWANYMNYGVANHLLADMMAHPQLEEALAEAA